MAQLGEGLLARAGLGQPLPNLDVLSRGRERLHTGSKKNNKNVCFVTL